MTDMKHTPGPWEMEPRRFPSQRVRVRAKIATVCQVSALIHQEANARLIAAAPDLLAALVTINAIASPNPERTFDGVTRDLNAMTDIARAAIAKAEGRS